MNEEKEEWGNIEIPNEEQKEIEFEIEEEAEPEQKAEPQKEEKPPELDGIETVSYTHLTLTTTHYV